MRPTEMPCGYTCAAAGHLVLGELCVLQGIPLRRSKRAHSRQGSPGKIVKFLSESRSFAAFIRRGKTSLIPRFAPICQVGGCCSRDWDMYTCPTAPHRFYRHVFCLLLPPGERFPRMWAAIAVFFVPEGVYMYFHPVGCKTAPSGPSCWQGAATPKASLTPAAPASFLIIILCGKPSRSPSFFNDFQLLTSI